MPARDRFGKNPIYYAHTPDGFYSASELKCVRAAGVPWEEDPEALNLYLQFGYVPVNSGRERAQPARGHSRR